MATQCRMVLHRAINASQIGARSYRVTGGETLFIAVSDDPPKSHGGGGGGGGGESGRAGRSSVCDIAMPPPPPPTIRVSRRLVKRRADAHSLVTDSRSCAAQRPQ